MKRRDLSRIAEQSRRAALEQFAEEERAKTPVVVVHSCEKCCFRTFTVSSLVDHKIPTCGVATRNVEGDDYIAALGEMTLGYPERCPLKERPVIVKHAWMTPEGELSEEYQRAEDEIRSVRAQRTEVTGVHTEGPDADGMVTVTLETRRR